MYIWYISLEFSVYQTSNALKLDLQRINVVIIKHGGKEAKTKIKPDVNFTTKFYVHKKMVIWNPWSMQNMVYPQCFIVFGILYT